MNEHRNRIEAVRAEIQSLLYEQNKIYELLVDELSVDGPKESWLWNYCFNCPLSDKIDDYTQRVREELGFNGEE